MSREAALMADEDVRKVAEMFFDHESIALSGRSLGTPKSSFIAGFKHGYDHRDQLQAADAFNRIAARVSDEEKEQVKAQLDGMDMQALRDELDAVTHRLEAAKHNASVWEYRATDRGYAEETDSLRARIANLESDKAQLTRERDVLASNFARAVTKDRRFEAAKAAMQGILANPVYAESWSDDFMNKTAVKHADALIKALEETK